MVSRVARWHPGPPRVAWCRLGLHALVALAGAGWAGATSAVQASLPAPTPIHWADTLWPLLLLVGAAQMLPSVRRDDAQAGAFGGFAIAAALVIFFDGAWAARLEESGWLIKLDGSSWHLVVVSSLTFLWPFLGRSLPRFAAAYRDTHAVLAAFCLVAPSSWVEQTLPLRALWCAPSLVLVGVLVGVATWRARPSTDLAPTAAATAAAIICCGAEVVLVITGLGSARPLPVVALAALVLGVLLTRTLRQGRLHNELEALRLHLERMVEDRTAELSTANQRLQGEIAERQLAEQGMRMLESAVEQSVDGIAVAGLEGGLLFLNQAWANMHGYEVMELLGYDLQVFHTREQFRDQVEPLLKLVASEGAQEAEIEHRRRGGATFPTWMTVTSLQDAAGAPMGYVFIARDLSERKRAEADRRALELRIGRAERLESLGTLAGGIAHDYNNILTGVLGNASLALSQLAGNAPTRPYLEAVEASAERAAGLTEQLLAFSGEERHLPREVDLDLLIEEAHDELQALLPAGGRLELYLRRDLPSVEVDPQQLRQVLVHLVANAVEAARDDVGMVMLRTGVVEATRKTFDGAAQGDHLPAGRYTFVEVSDDGVGMDEVTRDRMFEPFFSTKSSGRGLGLAAVSGIVRAHAGAIKVYSQPGRGTTVEVLLPAMVHRVASGVTGRPAAAWEADGCALVIDDEDMVREVALRTLQRQGFEVMSAGSGAEGLELLDARAGEVRLVLLDFTMPEMNGDEVFRRIREHDGDVKVIMMSGWRDADASLLDRLDGFLSKPFRANELAEKVREVLAAT